MTPKDIVTRRLRQQIERIPKGELSVMANTRNDEQTEATRDGWLAWLETQELPPTSLKHAWYGYSAVRTQ